MNQLKIRIIRNLRVFRLFHRRIIPRMYPNLLHLNDWQSVQEKNQLLLLSDKNVIKNLFYKCYNSIVKYDYDELIRGILNMTILLLEDDEAIAVGLKYSLEKEGYRVVVTRNVKEALLQIEKEMPDLFVLDLTLPDGSGYDVCKTVKDKGNYPVIFLTAFDDEVNVVMGLELGADDYISKPFRLKELMARIKSVMRRYSMKQSDTTVRIKDLIVNTSEAKVYKNGKEIELTAMEYRLLLIFINNRGLVLTRTQILENIWDVSGDFVNDNTLTVYIKRLRNKIEEDVVNPEYIKTVRGIGYVME